jgi:hypothetical protein
VVPTPTIYKGSLIPGWSRTPALIHGPLLTFSTDFTIKFMAAQNRIT